MQPAKAVRRSLARRWDRIVVDRAAVIVGRGAKTALKPDVAAAADQILLAALASAGRLSATERVGREPLEPAARVFLEWLAATPSATVSPELSKAITAAFVRLFQPVLAHVKSPAPEVAQAIVDQFHRLYYHVDPHPWERTYYRGHRILKLPLDLWIYGALIDEIKPSLIVETGTRFGGSALWLADQLELLGHGRVVTIDIEELPDRPEHPRITYLMGSSSDPAILDRVRELNPEGGPVLVVLDSDHSRDHVLAELRLFAPLVGPGSYLVVEDTNINGHPVLPNFGPGPMEAVETFLAETADFEVDSSREMFHFTMHPGGFLRRVESAG